MRIFPKLLASLCVAGAVALSAACFNRPHSGLDPESAVRVERGDDSTKVTVRVENQGFADVNVYAIPTSGGVRTRLGTVSGHSTEILQVPPQLLFGISELQFLADPIGGAEASLSDKVMVSPGDEVTLMIPPP
jgi:hypothetical protein